MYDFIDTFDDEQYFTTLYAYLGYWNMKINRKERPKKAFICYVGNLQCAQVTLGLKNVPACFQRAVYLIKWKTFLVYLDGVINFSNNLEDHIKQVEDIFSTLANVRVMIKINKRHCFKREVE